MQHVLDNNISGVSMVSDLVSDFSARRMLADILTCPGVQTCLHYLTHALHCWLIYFSILILKSLKLTMDSSKFKAGQVHYTHLVRTRLCNDSRFFASCNFT